MQNFTENSLDLINQGCALIAQQQYEAALEKFLLAQSDSPKYIECYINLGNVYSCLEICFLVIPNTTFLLFLCGSLLLEQLLLLCTIQVNRQNPTFEIMLVK